MAHHLSQVSLLRATGIVKEAAEKVYTMCIAQFRLASYIAWHNPRVSDANVTTQRELKNTQLSQNCLITRLCVATCM